MTYVVNIHEAKTQLSRLVERASHGEHIVIAKAGKPLVDLIPHRERKVTFGLLKDQLEYDDDVFDIDPDIQAMFYGDADAPA
ncbi:type II toxin-antitoxin system Phd/YefM family antitoxin [Glycomyces paridis]|uniref:Type II toxin-antitoxin system prevent-host-death family antitoxin n=1 Tax=Glycomyces paridis TaxID=2126555 RepID=A0A4S8PM61_9ACTN|nr:type II toxin-antitoxin system prevent-host-death family antitoxin [Glycomyces paridis]THV30722.1 type II toxin-antitoxin system prevent-host-death family antitoxin [Glycomyces paridis]